MAQKTVTSSMVLQDKVQPVFGTTNFSLHHVHEIRLSVPATTSLSFPSGASVHFKSFLCHQITASPGGLNLILGPHLA